MTTSGCFREVKKRALLLIDTITKSHEASRKLVPFSVVSWIVFDVGNQQLRYGDIKGDTSKWVLMHVGAITLKRKGTVSIGLLGAATYPVAIAPRFRD